MGYCGVFWDLCPPKASTQKKGPNKKMAGMTRKEARAETFRLLFETEFHADSAPEEIYALSKEARDIEENKYIQTVYFGVREHLAEIDELISRHSNGWKTGRITPISRSAMRICVYEMKYMADIPNAVSLNEAIELVKTFDDPKMRAFVNGVLNGVKVELEGNLA